MRFDLEACEEHQRLSYKFSSTWNAHLQFFVLSLCL